MPGSLRRNAGVVMPGTIRPPPWLNTVVGWIGPVRPKLLAFGTSENVDVVAPIELNGRGTAAAVPGAGDGPPVGVVGGKPKKLPLTPTLEVLKVSPPVWVDVVCEAAGLVRPSEAGLEL